jgi:hypothetical protein
MRLDRIQSPRGWFAVALDLFWVVTLLPLPVAVAVGAIQDWVRMAQA